MSENYFETILYEINGLPLFRLPLDISSDFPSRGMVMAKATLNQVPLIVALEPDGKGSHWFTIDSSLIKNLNLSLGDFVTITLESMGDWTKPELPKDLHDALRLNHLIEQWMSLTSKSQWDWIRWIRSTKNIATRLKRIDVACSKLSSGDRRPCCFNRNLCTVTEVSKSGILLDFNHA